MSFCLHDFDALVLNVVFEQVILLVILVKYTVFFTNQIMVCYMSAAHVPLVLSYLCNHSTLATTLLTRY